MAELVDAPVSGTGGRKPLEVRVFFWAPNSILIATQKREFEMLTLDELLTTKFLPVA